MPSAASCINPCSKPSHCVPESACAWWLSQLHGVARPLNGSPWLPWSVLAREASLGGGVVECRVGPPEVVGPGLHERRGTDSPPPRHPRHRGRREVSDVGRPPAGPLRSMRYGSGGVRRRCRPAPNRCRRIEDTHKRARRACPVGSDGDRMRDEGKSPPGSPRPAGAHGPPGIASQKTDGAGGPDLTRRAELERENGRRHLSFSIRSRRLRG